MDKNEGQIAKYLIPFDNNLVSLTQQLRHFFRKETNGGFELVGDSTISLNIGYGYTEKAWDCYCAIIVYSKHINLSFPSGASLYDPDRILQGSGKRIRHIRISSADDLENKEILSIIQDAKQLAIRLLDKTPTNNKIETIIKQIGGVKKRL